jgi:tetratricopeptide (TPR) repeat protein
MHLGEPSLARNTWLRAGGAPGDAVLAARVADTHFAAWDLDAADSGYHRAATIDPALEDAWLGLALVALERGRADEADAAASRALRMTADPRRRALLEGVVSLARPYAQSRPAGP